jgi:hypothetical protein
LFDDAGACAGEGAASLGPEARGAGGALGLLVLGPRFLQGDQLLQGEQHPGGLFLGVLLGARGAFLGFVEIVVDGPRHEGLFQGRPLVRNKDRDRASDLAGHGGDGGRRAEPQGRGVHPVRQLLEDVLRAPLRLRIDGALLGDRHPRRQPRRDLEIQTRPLDLLVEPALVAAHGPERLQVLHTLAAVERRQRR